MRRKKWDEISKRHVSVWKWRNYIEIVRAFSDINIGLPSFAIRCKVESRKTGLPEDPLYLETSVSKTIVRNNFPCRCHDCQSESRINIFMLFTHLLETMTSKVLSGPLSISFQIPVQKSNSRWVPICKVWTEWLLEGSHSDRTWLDRSHLASNYYCNLFINEFTKSQIVKWNIYREKERKRERKRERAREKERKRGREEERESLSFSLFLTLFLALFYRSLSLSVALALALSLSLLLSFYFSHSLSLFLLLSFSCSLSLVPFLSLSFSHSISRSLLLPFSRSLSLSRSLSSFSFLFLFPLSPSSSFFLFLFLSQNIKNRTFCRETLKYGIFVAKILTYAFGENYSGSTQDLRKSARFCCPAPSLHLLNKCWTTILPNSCNNAMVVLSFAKERRFYISLEKF